QDEATDHDHRHGADAGHEQERADVQPQRRRRHRPVAERVDGATGDDRSERGEEGVDDDQDDADGERGAMVAQVGREVAEGAEHTPPSWVSPARGVAGAGVAVGKAYGSAALGRQRGPRRGRYPGTFIGPGLHCRPPSYTRNRRTCRSVGTGATLGRAGDRCLVHGTRMGSPYGTSPRRNSNVTGPGSVVSQVPRRISPPCTETRSTSVRRPSSVVAHTSAVWSRMPGRIAHA